MQINIRPAVREDASELVEMVKALLIHLEDGIDDFVPGRFIEDAFGEEPQFTVLVAEAEGGALIGYTIFQDAYEPSHSARGIYIVDLYVAGEARGTGVGTKLLQAAAKDADQRGRDFLWLVTTSDQAKKYYETVMDVSLDVTAYALTGAHFQALLQKELSK